MGSGWWDVYKKVGEGVQSTPYRPDMEMRREKTVEKARIAVGACEEALAELS